MGGALARLNNEQLFTWRSAGVSLVLGFIASAVAAVIAFFIVDAAGLLPNSVTIDRMNGDNGPIGAVDVFGTVLFDWVIAAVVFLLLRAFTKRPLKWFLIIATVVLIGSFALPAIQIENVPAKMVVGLDILHVVAAISGVGVLYRYLRSRA